ncbi:MAG: ACP S-malonyltransferase [bacterium]
MTRFATVGLVFPGQGSQYVGMGKKLYEHYKEAKEIFEKADEALGYSISKICFDGPEELLKLTENTQPALLTVSYAVYRILSNRISVNAQFMTGHSLGEYSALVAAESIKFEDAVVAVHKRGKFMQEAVPVGEGGMLAVLGMEDFEVEEACKEVDPLLGIVTTANYNSPGQIVVSGNTKALESLISILKDKGAKKVVPLPVSAPFHSPLMAEAADRLAEVLSKIEIKEPKVKVISNVTAEPYNSAEEVRSLLVSQVKSPVRWVDCIKFMTSKGVNEFIEIGAGKVLSGLIKRIEKDVKTVNIEHPEEIELFLKLY